MVSLEEVSVHSDKSSVRGLCLLFNGKKLWPEPHLKRGVRFVFQKTFSKFILKAFHNLLLHLSM